MPPSSLAQRERHLVDRIGWLRAAVLGANDGIVSTASLIVGVAAAAATRDDVLIAGVAGLVAGKRAPERGTIRRREVASEICSHYPAERARTK